MVPNDPLGRPKITVLAEASQLFEPTKLNPHLAYTTGDVSYWSEQPAGLRRAQLIWAQFLARRLTLEEADRQGRRLPTQGDLSHEAGPLVAELIGVAEEVWLTAGS